MKTVQLPIYKDGVMTTETLEVDISFFLMDTFRYAKVVPAPPLADWQKEILYSGANHNEVELVDIYSKHPDVISMDDIREIDPDFDVTLKEDEEQEDDWWDLYGLIPTHAFEINHKGAIRIKANQKVIEPNWFDIDQNCWNVMLIVNGMEYYLNGPRIAAEMKKQG
jgi:hypothetical protein